MTSNGLRVLMISGDRNILKEGSVVYERAIIQRSQVERLDIFVWPQVHSWREVLRTARAGEYDVMTSQDPFWRGLLAWRAARLSGARLNIQVHADLDSQSLVKQMLARFVLRRADSIRAVSENIRAYLTRLNLRAQISVLPVFVNVSRFTTLHRQSHERKTILWMGRFEREKDPVYAMQVLEQVRHAGVDAKLVMLGAGSMEKGLRARAMNLPVEFPGWKDPKPFLEVADVVLCTSHHESWGASIVEALAAGVPVVAPDVGIAREAGAIIAPREKMVDVVIDVLKNGTKGELKLTLPSAEAWAKQWKESLI